MDIGLNTNVEITIGYDTLAKIFITALLIILAYFLIAKYFNI